MRCWIYGQNDHKSFSFPQREAINKAEPNGKFLREKEVKCRWRLLYIREKRSPSNPEVWKLTKDYGSEEVAGPFKPTVTQRKNKA